MGIDGGRAVPAGEQATYIADRRDALSAAVRVGSKDAHWSIAEQRGLPV